MDVKEMAALLHEALKTGVNPEGIQVTDAVQDTHIAGRFLVKMADLITNQGHRVRVITQNPNKINPQTGQLSKWAVMAREGNQVAHVYPVGPNGERLSGYIGKVINGKWFKAG